MDARLELWEELCTCGGKNASPDVRMCNCLAPGQAGLDCQGCNAGVLLIKGSSRLFWGCSMYKKLGCKFTRPFGPPHDRQAARELAQLRNQKQNKRQRLEQELECIVDPHELEWRNECQCEGARNLDTFECYMRSEGGCGFLPLCPQCQDALFLKNGKFGMYWQCKNRKSGCKYHASYKPHSSPAKKMKKEAPNIPIRDSSNQTDNKKPAAFAKQPPVQTALSVSAVDTTSNQDERKPASSLSPEQKAMIEANRQAALARLHQRAEEKSAQTSAETSLKESDGSSPAAVKPPGGDTSTMTTTTECQNAQNEPLYKAFMELADLYGKEGNYNAKTTYFKVAEAIKTLEMQVTSENAKGLGKGKTKIAHIGKASADKMYEFVTSGKIAKLQEKRDALGKAK